MTISLKWQFWAVWCHVTVLQIGRCTRAICPRSMLSGQCHRCGLRMEAQKCSDFSEWPDIFNFWAQKNRQIRRNVLHSCQVIGTMLLRSGREPVDQAQPDSCVSPGVSTSKLLPWLRLPLVYLTSLNLHRPLFSQRMVDKEQKATLGLQAQPKVQVAAKLDTEQTNTSGDSVEPGAVPPTGPRRCFVTSTKGSKLLLFVDRTTDVAHILSKPWHHRSCLSLSRGSHLTLRLTFRR